MNKILKCVLAVAAVPVIAGAAIRALPDHLQPSAAAGPSDFDMILWRTKNVEAAEAKIRGLLKDPDSAQFRSVTVVQQKLFDANAVGVVCGYVNAKNAFGGYVGYKGFLVSAHLLILDNGDNTTAFARVWNRECANKPAI